MDGALFGPRFVHMRVEPNCLSGLYGPRRDLADHASGARCADRHVGARQHASRRADKTNLHSSGHAAARGEQRLRRLAGRLADDHRTRRHVAAHHRSEEWRTVDSKRSSDLYDPPSDGRRVSGASQRLPRRGMNRDAHRRTDRHGTHWRETRDARDCGCGCGTAALLGCGCERMVAG